MLNFLPRRHKIQRGCGPHYVGRIKREKVSSESTHFGAVVSRFSKKIVDRGEGAEFHNFGELFARCHIKSDPMVQRLTKLTDHKGN